MEQAQGPGQEQPVLLRKLARKRAAPADEGAGEAPPRSHPFERALARVCAGIGAGLHATARLTTRREVGQAELLDMIEPDGFLTLLAPAETGAEAANGDGETVAGLMALDRAGFMALVEILTTGRMLPGERPPRRATPTDAALLADFIDHLLDLRAQENEKQGGNLLQGRAGWQRGRFVADARLLPVLLEEGRFALEALEIDFALGDVARSGRLLLALPPAPDAPIADADDAEAGAGGVPAGGAAWHRQMEAMVMGVPARVDAVLGRVELPLAEALALKPGSRLTMPVGQLEAVRLESADHRLLALARLGQYRGMRAVRLTAMSEGEALQSAASAAPPAAMPGLASLQGEGGMGPADDG